MKICSRGFWVCRFKKSRETGRHSKVSRPKLEIKDGHHHNTFPPINRLKVFSVPIKKNFVSKSMFLRSRNPHVKRHNMHIRD